MAFVLRDIHIGVCNIPSPEASHMSYLTKQPKRPLTAEAVEELATGQVKTMSEQLAEWALGIRFSDSPYDVQQALRSCLLYNISMALAVNPHSDRLGTILEGAAQSPGPVPTFMGRGSRSVTDAAFINAGLVTARGQNDTHPDTLAHIGCVVIPAVLAAANVARPCPSDVVDALLVGYEVIPRIAERFGAESAQRGFRATPIYGVLGASVACSRVMGLTVQQTVNAISIATNLAGGLLQTWIEGTDEWRLQIARASQSAVLAAHLASLGMRGARNSIEGSSGFAGAYAAAGSSQLDLSGWRVREIAFKPYPGCALNQAPVHSLRTLLLNTGVNADEVSSVDLFMHPLDASYPGVDAYGPFTSAAGAIMSAPFMLAATLIAGRPTATHFETEFAGGCFHDRARHVHLHASESIARGRCRILVQTKSGSSHTISFDEEAPFRQSWDGALMIARDVSRELDKSSRDDQLATLVRAVERIDEQAGLTELEGLIYSPSGAT